MELNRSRKWHSTSTWRFWVGSDRPRAGIRVIDRGVRGLYVDAKVAVESIPMLGHSDPEMGVSSRRRVQEQPKK